MGNFGLLILVHAFADLILQGDKLSKLKQQKWLFLLLHVGIYSVVLLMTALFLLFLPIQQSFFFVLINGGTHFLIDLITGSLKKKFWTDNKEGSLFITSSIDQLLHIGILFASYQYIYQISPV